MRRLVNVQEVEGDGLMAFMGERITLYCLNYIYTGLLIGVNDTCVVLKDAAIVYETGPLLEKDWKEAQGFPSDWYVQISSIESFGRLK
jgi:hypothetical protein